LIKETETQWSTSLIITNTLNIEANANESIYLDYESYRFNLSYQYGLNRNWNLKLDLPIIHQSGGFLDSAIDSWHSFFGLPQANRPFIPHDEYEISYAVQNQTPINLNESNTTLGDLQIAAARSILDKEKTSISLWTSIKLPTGDKNKLSSNGATDVSAWLALNQQLSEKWLLNVNTGLVILGKDSYQNVPLSDYALYGHAMLGWVMNDSVNLKAQLQGHTSYYDESQLTMLGDTYFLTFGGTVKINACHQLDIAFSEDIKVEASPDASFIISWRANTSC